MNEDMSDMIKNLSSMLNGKEMPEDIKNIISNIASNNNNHNNSNNNSNTHNNNCSSNNQYDDDISSDSRSNNSNFNEKSTPDIDIGMILKMKQIMDSMKNNKDDPRANLLLSLKPYLKNSRQEKVDQYIKLFNMSKVFEVINPLGGDTKNGI
ncbi:MAG: hypothetical protein J6D03_06215 [Clostridia bacterium]|nr:hypothetical protein [Clostridia bacterium]